jgi:HAD superfamily hydrolase (TIGR01509 family)
MKYKAIIFDMDGVLIDSEFWFEKCENKFFQRYVAEFTEKDRLSIIGGSLKNTYEYIKNKYGISCTEKDFIESYTKFGIENIYEKTNLIKGVKDFLDKLKFQKIPLALASSSYYAWINTALDRLDLRKYFDFVVSAEDLNGKGKPAPDIYLRSAKLLNVDPKDCLVFEDSEKGVTSGKDAGMTVYGIRNGVNEDQNLNRVDKIFYNYNELTELNKK